MYKTKEEMPLFLTVMDVANLLGISRASSYEQCLTTARRGAIC